MDKFPIDSSRRTRCFKRWLNLHPFLVPRFWFDWYNRYHVPDFSCSIKFFIPLGCCNGHRVVFFLIASCIMFLITILNINQVGYLTWIDLYLRPIFKTRTLFVWSVEETFESRYSRQFMNLVNNMRRLIPTCQQRYWMIKLKRPQPYFLLSHIWCTYYPNMYLFMPIKRLQSW